MKQLWWFLKFIWQFRQLLSLGAVYRLLLRIWTTPNTMATNALFSSSDYNTYLRDNLNYLFSGRPGQVIIRDNGASYTSTSLTFVDVDVTNLIITLTISSGKVLIMFSGVTAGNNWTMVDVSVDGTRYGTGFADGLVSSVTTSPANVSFSVIKTGLSVGSHVFKLQYRWDNAAAAQAGLSSGNGVSPADAPIVFSVVEIG